ncbi:MAG: hypothetical protein IJ258_02670 [Methanobrevibacter sp.]|uniref:hypothetical protein n=1 Tax=Methanobrevibacter sp. TaxID=66852 RepID=UPI0025CE55C8|nr:hypothetical protein [Methanobrevibacter sp.]MBQ8016987.1 hypothetical protein [Methanobrevibacter sp.]
MKYKTLLTICLIACVLFTISSVNAIDENETIIANEDNQEIIQETNEDIVTTPTDDDILKTDDGTFTALQNKINSASSGSTITLENDYTYDDGFDTNGIKISRSIIIDGNGHTLNGLSKSRIFKISGGNIAIKNVNFVNGYISDNGGAVYSIANGIDFTNCNFNNNYADYGAALYIDYKLTRTDTSGPFTKEGGAYTTITNCKFTNNKVRIQGAAIFWGGDNGKLDSCTFENNAGDSNAVYWTGEYGTINNCQSITQNSNEGKIYVYKDNTVVNGFKVTVKSNSQSSTSTSKTVKKLTPKLTAKAATFKVKTKTKKYSVILKTNKNKAMKKVKLYLKVNGKTFTAKTNSKGKAIFKITNLKKKKTFKAIVTYKGNTNYKKVSKTIKIKCK